MTRHVVILGGGLAGLSSAYETSKRGLRVESTADYEAVATEKTWFG